MSLDSFSGIQLHIDGVLAGMRSSHDSRDPQRTADIRDWADRFYQRFRSPGAVLYEVGTDPEATKELIRIVQQRWSELDAQAAANLN